MATPRQFLAIRNDAQRCLQHVSQSAAMVPVCSDFAEVSEWCGQVSDPVGRILHDKHEVPWNEAAQVMWRGIRFGWLLGDLAAHCVLPTRDLARFDCSKDALSTNPRGLGRLITFEAYRAHSLLDAGVSVLANSPLGVRIAWSEQVGRTRAYLHAVRRAGATQLETHVQVRPTTWMVPANRLRLDSRRYGHALTR